MTIGVTMIVRDEERLLARCLSSFRNHVDELVIVDTGSTDGTKNVAERFDARLFDFTWIDDFSAARQFALDRSTTDWVCWIDADEVARHAERLNSVIEAAAPHIGRIDLPQIYGRDGRGEPTFRFWRERCVRNDGGFRWTGSVHEVLIDHGQHGVLQTDDVVIEHLQDGEPERRSGRNLRILERDFRARDGALEPRMLFYYGRELATAGEGARAVEILSRCVAESGWADERYRAQIDIAEIHQRAGESEAATNAYLEALKILPRWPDSYFGLAVIAFHRRDWENVVHWSEIGRSLPMPNTIFFVNLRAYQFDWIIIYTNALIHLGRLEDAARWTQHALGIFPGDEMHLANRRLFEERLGVTLVSSLTPER